MADAHLVRPYDSRCHHEHHRQHALRPGRCRADGVGNREIYVLGSSQADSGYCTWVWREHSCAHVDQCPHVLSGMIFEQGRKDEGCGIQFAQKVWEGRLWLLSSESVSNVRPAIPFRTTAFSFFAAVSCSRDVRSGDRMRRDRSRWMNRHVKADHPPPHSALPRSQLD